MVNLQRVPPHSFQPGIQSQLNEFQLNFRTVFQLVYSCHGLVTALILTCNCDLVKSFANVSSYFNQRYRNVEYGTGEVVSASDLNLLVWKDESNIV